MLKCYLTSCVTCPLDFEQIFHLIDLEEKEGSKEKEGLEKELGVSYVRHENKIQITKPNLIIMSTFCLFISLKQENNVLHAHTKCIGKL